MVYAGTGNGIYKSVDGGATWTHKGLTGILVKAIAIHPSNPQVVYVGARSGTSTGVVFKSTDGGETWQQKFSEANLWVNTLLIDTTIPNRIYLGASGEPQGSGGVPQGLRISSDGGNSWNSHKVTTLEWRSRDRTGDDAHGIHPAYAVCRGTQCDVQKYRRRSDLDQSMANSQFS